MEPILEKKDSPIQIKDLIQEYGRRKFKKFVNFGAINEAKTTQNQK